MEHYDIIIVGGGIAGLFCALHLSSSKKILLIEKNSYLGGRIDTFDEKVDGKQVTYEIGAGRIASSHTRTMQLIKQYSLDKKLVENINKKIHILGNQDYSDLTDKDRYKKLYRINSDEKFNIQFLLDKVIKASDRYKKQELINMSLFNLIQLELSSDASQFLFDAYGYVSELLDINAFDGIYSLKSGFGKHNKYYSMIGGLKQLIDKIASDLKTNNVQILMKKNFKEYSYSTRDNLFTVKLGGFLNEQLFTCDKLILALPRNALRKINGCHNSSKLMRNIYSVKPHPLCRIYAIFPKNKETGRVWFYNLNKVTTDNVIQYIIPINKESGLIMISYSDNLYADYWNEVRRQNNVKKTLMVNLKRLFPTFNIPEPTFVNTHYWKEGCHYYNVGVDSQKVREEILRPFPKKHLYICGEAYSQDQAWIEGALETAEKVISNINKVGGGNNIDISTLPEYTIKEVAKHNTKEDAWIVIDNLVLNITKWIPIHPGGDVILKGLGKDFTKEWWNIRRHNADIRDKYFPKLIIGKIKN